MAESFDVVVVGARCAGAPTALLLARAGLRVCVVDRSRFPSEVPSTHAIQPSGVASLTRLGLLGRVQATGAPAINQFKMDIDGVVLDQTGGPGFLDQAGAPMYCVRRSSLDIQLIEAAVDAGAEFRPQTAATGVSLSGGRVKGIETPNGSIDAALVVGADGPHSAIARMVGSREYHVTPPGRLFMWGYFEGVRGAAPRLWIAKKGDTALLAAPTDGDLFLVAVVPSLADKARFLADTARGLQDSLGPFEEVAGLVAGAQLAGPVRTMSRWHGYFREATGPGWVLVGDAGHFKDPTPGQGIADALRQAEHLAPAIVGGVADGTLDSRLAAWARWRDEDAWEMYWFASDMGAPGPTRPLVREMIRQVVEHPRRPDRFLELMDHRLAPSKVFTPARAVSAGVTLLATRQAGPGQVARDLNVLMRQEFGRRRLRRHPRYVVPDSGIESDPESVGAATGA